MKILTYKNQLNEWEFEKLVQCQSAIVETMILQRVQVHDTKSPAHTDLEDGLLDSIGINARGLYYINRGYCCFTAYFQDPKDRDDFAILVQNYSQK